MDFKNKKFIASYSGGKDCTLAIYRAIKLGMIPVGLITTYNSDMNRSWFHGIPEPVLNRVGESLGVPVSLIRTNDTQYRECFVKELSRQKALGAQTCVFGDIDIEGHLEWCTEVCREAGIEPYFPLWQQPREDLVREVIEQGFTAHITVVDTQRLSPDLLGKTLTLPRMDTIRTQGADVCGENGEYHTFVSDGPIFSQPVTFSFGDVQCNGGYAVLPILSEK